MNANVVFARVAPQLDLSKDLVGEGVAHHEGRVTVSTAQINQSAFSQYDHVTSVIQGIPVYLQEGRTFSFSLEFAITKRAIRGGI